MTHPPIIFFFFFNDTATTEIYTLSLHDALPISQPSAATSPPSRSMAAYSALRDKSARPRLCGFPDTPGSPTHTDRKSTRLNSSHSQISYAVFCLKKKKKTITTKIDHRATLATPR